MNFVNEVTEIPAAQMKCLKERSARKEKSNCGNQVAEIVGEERGERKKELWQPSCRNWRKRKELWQPSCRNWGRKLEEKKKGIVEAKLPKLKKKKKKEKN